jgi:hypothetical protein
MQYVIWARFYQFSVHKPQINKNVYPPLIKLLQTTSTRFIGELNVSQQTFPWRQPQMFSAYLKNRNNDSPT